MLEIVAGHFGRKREKSDTEFFERRGMDISAREGEGTVCSSLLR